METKKIQVEPHDLYRLIVTQLRYCYTRNNHLEPTCSYENIRETLLPDFFKVDPDMALHTAKQICEECISDEICMHFFDGEDDEFGNRQYSIEFVNYLLNFIHQYDEKYLPYNYDSFIYNLKHDDEKIYLIYEENADNTRNLVSEEKFSVKEYLNYLFKTVLDLTEEELIMGVYYNKERLKNSYYDEKTGQYIKKPDNFRYIIKKPVNRTFYIKNTRKNEQ